MSYRSVRGVVAIEKTHVRAFRATTFTPANEGLLVGVVGARPDPDLDTARRVGADNALRCNFHALVAVAAAPVLVEADADTEIALLHHGGSDNLKIIHGAVVFPEIFAGGRVPGIETHQELLGNLDITNLELLANNRPGGHGLAKGIDGHNLDLERFRLRIRYDILKAALGIDRRSLRRDHL